MCAVTIGLDPQGYCVDVRTMTAEQISTIQAMLPTSMDWSVITSKPTTFPGFGMLPLQAAASRALNSGFQVSLTRPALVIYSVQITVTASIAGGQNGDVFLDIASDSGFSVSLQSVPLGLGQTYTLAVALQGVQPQSVTAIGFVPAASWVRLRTVNNTGTPAYSYRAGQEILF